jgi:hypothetical protein
MVRGANWLDNEDAQLARSWLHNSQNPIFVNSMKQDQFWEKAAKHFNEKSPGQERNATSLKNRSVKFHFLYPRRTMVLILEYFVDGPVSIWLSLSSVAYMTQLSEIHHLDPKNVIV